MIISPYQVEYTMTIGNRVVGECITVYASSKFFAIEKVSQELHRRFGSSTSIELHNYSRTDSAPERITIGI
ncbi:hypothetical protein [Bacillus sp. OTU530]|uniref:hypothetical protein n=1 Tax=Bacillus sp. OTU530 TaxID=3043862 RepID=UPI00313E1CB9